MSSAGIASTRLWDWLALIVGSITEMHDDDDDDDDYNEHHDHGLDEIMIRFMIHCFSCLGLMAKACRG